MFYIFAFALRNTDWFITNAKVELSRVPFAIFIWNALPIYHVIVWLMLSLVCSVRTVSEFAQELGAAMESHSANVRRLVDEFRSRSGDSRIDVGGMRRVWENLLRQVEADAASHLDLAAMLQQQLSRPTLEASFHRKLQSRKVSSSTSRIFFYVNL